jgi:signal peptidase I
MEQESSRKEISEVVKNSKTFREKILYGILVIVSIFLIINMIFFRYYWIPSGSMEPTLKIKDRIIVNKASYWVNKPVRGEIVVFRYPLNVKKHYIKRIIGLPGEKVEIKNSVVYIDDRPLVESYIEESKYNNYGPVAVPEGYYFVLGDNRVNSMDSRVWGFVANEHIIGKVVYCYWPLEHITSIYN